MSEWNGSVCECVKLFGCGGNAPGSPFQLEIPGVVGGGVIPLADSSLLRIPLGRPAVVGVERGRGQLQTVAPACHVVCKSATHHVSAIV